MAQLQLFFVGDDRPQLERTIFHHPLNSEAKISVRGRSSIGAATGSFGWSRAVQALCLLFINEVIQNETTANPQEFYIPLQGEAGSLAASLDYSISKKTNWIVDMFGVDSRGEALVHRILHRRNSNLRRKGPVSLLLNSKVLAREAITFHWKGKVLETQGELEELVESLSLEKASGVAKLGAAQTPKLDPSTSLASPASAHETSLFLNQTPDPENQPLPFPFCDPAWLARLSNSFFEEILANLHDTDVFSRPKEERAITALMEDADLLAVAGKQVSYVSDIDRSLGGFKRMGVPESPRRLKEALCREEPIRLKLSISHVSVMAICYYLRFIKGYNIEINFAHSHSLYIAEKARSGNFYEPTDGLTLGLAAAAALLGKSHQDSFKPLMILPKASYRIVTALGSKPFQGKADKGSYLLMTDMESTAGLIYRNMISEGLLSKKRVETVYAEQHDLASYLDSGERDLRGILWFPYYKFHEWFNGAESIPLIDGERTNREIVLFLSDELINDHERAEALDLAIRDAWLHLKSGGEPLRKVVDLITRDPSYVTKVLKAAGFYPLREELLKGLDVKRPGSAQVA